ncbi:hypothetical protein [Salinicola aestuarinus]|uniref:hypothetical protein n=1 Tax=Salinicola aestuarinus TaxID=1949082 RepID=UPI00130046C9|nr:hypothetical protein [Salinicola aestuarinus]
MALSLGQRRGIAVAGRRRLLPVDVSAALGNWPYREPVRLARVLALSTTRGDAMATVAKPVGTSSVSGR